MKVLAISLLRLGDLILQKPLLEGIKRQQPDCEIHLLLNKQFASVEFLFAGVVDRFIYFDRQSLQRSCGEKEYSLFWGYRKLRTLVTEINQNQYDSVYNLTHNRMTAHIAGLIQSKSIFGIYSKAGEFFGLSNPWIRFFNSYFGRIEAEGFHYTELLAASLEIPLEVSPSARGPKILSGPNKSAILIQPLTSDAKKNWSLSKYQSLASALHAATGHPVHILGAPFEREVLEAAIDKKFLKICDLEEAASLLKSCIALITGDTSIKHLGALYDIPILELALGSSQPLQVGAYSNHSIILQPRVTCGPCPHSTPCTQPSHKCGNELTVGAVLEAGLGLLRQDPQIWFEYAHHHPDLRVFKTAIRPVVGWSVECISLGDKNKFDEIFQQKTMIVDELNRRHQANQTAIKGATHEPGTGEVSRRSPEAS